MKNPQVATARLWETPETGMDYEDIGEVMEAALLIPVGEAIVKLTSTDTPSLLEYNTGNVKINKIAGITVNYCLVAKKNAQPGIHRVAAEYSFYTRFDLKPYAVRKVEVIVHIVQP